MLDIKVLGYKNSNRFLIRRVVVAALETLKKTNPIWKCLSPTSRM